jgi:ABC-type multidrug transport system ATPase subunit
MGLLERVGAMVESPSLYPNLTGRENLEVTRRLTGGAKAQIGQALDIVRLGSAAGRRVSEYSTGMKQRLGLALALLRTPELLILDEPTNGLDPAGIHEMRELLCHLPREYGVTVFLHAQMKEQIVLGVDLPELAKGLLNATGWTVHGNGGHRLTVAANGRSDAAMINAQLIAGGVNVYHLVLEQPTLEDIFLTLTNDTQGGH